MTLFLTDFTLDLVERCFFWSAFSTNLERAFRTDSIGLLSISPIALLNEYLSSRAQINQNQPQDHQEVICNI